MSKTNFKSRLVAILVTILVTGLIGWGIEFLALPAMTFHSSGFWWFWLCMGIIAALVYFAVNGITNSIKCEDGGYLPGLIILGVTAIWLVAFIVTAIAGGEMTNAQKYSNLIDVETGDFAEDIDQINLDNLVVVDVKTAQQLGNRTIANIENSSWYEVDSEYNLAVIKGKEYRISPVNYGGIWKFFKADEVGIPGYVLVDAKDQDEEARYVELEENIKYSPSACMEYDLTRHLRRQYPTYIFGKSFFEVDDNGTPFWITSVQTPQIGMRGGNVVTSVLVTNAANGDTEEYALDVIPEWVDHVDSVDHLMTLLNWHYSYWNGWWNSFTSQTKVYKTSYYYKDQEQSKSQDEDNIDLEANKHTPFEGYNSIVTKEGKVLFYTGLTPANKAESNIGFLLIDPIAQKFTYYKATGAEESSAQKAVEGLVSDHRYSASFPTVVNVDGIETYFMVLKDGAGLIQRYAFANVKNYSLVVQADTKEEALRLYKIKIGLTSEDDANEIQNNQNNNPEVETTELTGKVVQIQEAQIEGFTYYYFTLEGNNMIFMSSIENSNLQPMMLKIGNFVTINYYESIEENGIGIVTTIKFE